MRAAFWIIGLAIIALLGCASEIRQQDAEGIARQFALNHAKFYSKLGNGTVAEQATIESTSAYKQGDTWIVAMHIASSNKSADVTVELEKSSGKVTKFNGKQV